jgi:predicted nucleic acid-binding protein
VSRWYVDTSAALKLLVEEVESAALAEAVDGEGPELVSCLLLETELRRVVAREPGLTQAAVTRLLDAVDLFELPPALFVEAGLLPGARLRSLDALHLAAAIRLEVDGVLTYDRRMAEGAESLGMSVVAPA